jgi:hypothetical protein
VLAHTGPRQVHLALLRTGCPPAAPLPELLPCRRAAPLPELCCFHWPGRAPLGGDLDSCRGVCRDAAARHEAIVNGDGAVTRGRLGRGAERAGGQARHGVRPRRVSPQSMLLRGKDSSPPN